MKNLMCQVYELTNLALLTPQNLVENIKLENYLEIKYYREDKEIVCEMITEEENERVHYMYYFNGNSQLQQVFALCENERIELFDRNKELNMLLDEYDRNKKVHTA